MHACPRFLCKNLLVLVKILVLKSYSRPTSCLRTTRFSGTRQPLLRDLFTGGRIFAGPARRAFGALACIRHFPFPGLRRKRSVACTPARYSPSVPSVIPLKIVCVAGARPTFSIRPGTPLSLDDARRRALQRPLGQCHRTSHPRTCSPGVSSCGAGSEAQGGEKTAAESSATSRVAHDPRGEPRSCNRVSVTGP